MCSEIDVVVHCLHQSDRYCQSREIIEIKGELFIRRMMSGGAAPGTVQLERATPDLCHCCQSGRVVDRGIYPLPLMSKGERK